jgi:hypothetical protein
VVLELPQDLHTAPKLRRGSGYLAKLPLAKAWSALWRLFEKGAGYSYHHDTWSRTGSCASYQNNLTFTDTTAMMESSVAAEIPQVAFKKRTAKSKPTFRKRAATPPPASYSDSGFTSSEDEEGRQIKRRRKNAGVTASSTTQGAAHIEVEPSNAVKAVPIPHNSDDATKASNWYDDDKDGELSSKNLLGTARSRPAEPSMPDGTYKGRRELSILHSKKSRHNVETSWSSQIIDEREDHYRH